MNRAKFFDGIRNQPFHKKLTAPQVAGVTAILDEWEARGLKDNRWLAYILATTFWETARTMQPIREYGRGAGRAYGNPDRVTGKTYYGRGFVQLTWKKNYEKMGSLLRSDLVNNPDLALDVKIATQILFAGMIGGMFTGKKLMDYFNGKTTDWVGARRIINGTDQAQTIAGIAKQFYADIVGAT